MRQGAGIASHVPDTPWFFTKHDRYNQLDCARPSGAVTSRKMDSQAVSI